MPGSIKVIVQSLTNEGTGIIIRGEAWSSEFLQVEHLIHEVRRPPDIPYDSLVQRIRQFRVDDFLKFCNRVAVRLDDVDQPKAKVPVSPSYKYQSPGDERIYVTLWGISFLAKSSVLHSTDLMHGRLTRDDFIGLLYMHVNLVDATVADLGDGRAQLIRIAWEQFGYQGRPTRVIPRAWLMLVEGNRTIANPLMDLEQEWLKLTGLNLEKFMKVGFAYFSGALAFSAVRWDFPSRGALEESITTEDCELFLARAAATYAEFRALAEPRTDKPFAKTEFNPLLPRPIVRMGKNEVTAPVPKLVLDRITNGLRFDLMDAFSYEERNPFREYFGLLFEEYVGRLLRWTFGDDKVFAEPRYGEPEERGPDWVVIDGETAILIECRTSGLRLDTKVYGDMPALVDDIRRVVFGTVKRYPKKVDDLRNGRTPVDVTGVSRFECVVLLYDRVFFETVYRDLVKEEFTKEGTPPANDYVLMDINDFELLSAWNEAKPMAEVIHAYRDAYAQQPLDFWAFLVRFGQDHELSEHHPLLAQTFEEFFSSQFGDIEPVNEDVLGVD